MFQCFFPVSLRPLHETPVEHDAVGFHFGGVNTWWSTRARDDDEAGSTSGVTAEAPEAVAQNPDGAEEEEDGKAPGAAPARKRPRPPEGGQAAGAALDWSLAVEVSLVWGVAPSRPKG